MQSHDCAANSCALAINSLAAGMPLASSTNLRYLRSRIQGLFFLVQRTEKEAPATEVCDFSSTSSTAQGEGPVRAHTSQKDLSMPKTLHKVAVASTRSENPTVNTQQLRKFKKFFHQQAPAHYAALPGAPKADPRPLSLRGALKSHIEALTRASNRGSGIFMVINRGGTRDRLITEITSVFIDSDGQMTLDDILKLKPHLVVSTSAGKYHAYWRVADLPVQDFKAFQQALAQKFGTDPSVCNPARIMRMAGTVHRKDRPQLVRIKYIEADAKPVSATKLAKLLGLDVKAHNPSAEQTEREATLPELQSALAVIPADDRGVWLKIGMAVHSVMPGADGRKLWNEWSRGSRKFDADDQERTWRSFVKGGGVSVASLYWLAGQHGWKPAGGASGALPTDELAFVDLFAQAVKGRLRYDTAAGRWLVFKGHVWRADEAEAVQVARTVVEPLHAQAKAEGAQGPLVLFRRYTGVAGLRSLLRDASAVPDLNVARDALDHQPGLLAVANGVVDLATGQHAAGQPDQLLTMQAPTDFVADATCPQFLKFLRFVTRRNDEYARYLQRALGYTLYGHTNEQVFFIVFGASGNGKGTLFRIIAHVLGPYVTTVQPNLLSRAYASNPQGPSPAFMALLGPRMYQCGEGSNGQRFDTAFVKGLSGSDALSGRATYGDQATFTPQGKLWLSVNSLPEVPSQDRAMWRRILVLPFNAKIKHQDGAFEDRLKEEAPGILNWLIQGAVQYAKHRLGECQVVKEATAKARRSSDSVATWINEKCRVDEDAEVQASAAYENYRKLCRANGTAALSIPAFGHAMKAKGHPRKSTNRYNVFVGLELREE
jgi:putative DNA primase/helicase